MAKLTDGGGSATLGPGETRTIYDRKSERTWTLRRSTRAYAYDLADAYNAELPPGCGKAWSVSEAGQLYFGDTIRRGPPLKALPGGRA